MKSNGHQVLGKLGIVTNLPDGPVTLGNWDPRDAVEAPWHHANVFERTTAGQKPVLIAGAKTDHLRLLRSLMNAWEPPFWILYVLSVPRALGDRGAGRYASDMPLSVDAVENLFAAYGEFVEHDARHQLWITPDSERSSPLVYDQRNRIFAYGPVDDHAAVCSAAGLVEGPVVIPSGLARHYHAEFDAAEVALVAGDRLAWSWRQSPLLPMDED